MNPFLTAQELAILAQGKKPYFKLWVRAEDQQSVAYVGTEEQTLNYDPVTYQGRWDSNLSVVMKIKNVGKVDDPKYHISNIVIPNTYLEVTSAKLTGDDYQVRFLYNSNISDIPAFTVKESNWNDTYLEIINEKSLYIKPITVNYGGRISKVMAVSATVYDRIGITYIPNFNLPGLWTTDEEWPAFHHHHHDHHDHVGYGGKVIKEVDRCLKVQTDEQDEPRSSTEEQ
ncbi:uncharacterized protein LOC135336600 [Halichondria panicea]|uniref:uncharacterized protein LOC135336600 n=1 Tax=Halichondria panicea TaxID=6063 RepID=UPI00312B7ED8